MIPLDEARQTITSLIRTLPFEYVPLTRSYSHVLATGIFADADYPSADRSMMDGYVIALDAAPGTFEVTAEIPAGRVPEKALGKGEAMRIFTGAMLPPGGGRVVMQEDCQRNGSKVSIPAFPGSTFIRPKASEAKTGDSILEKGTKITATEMAMLAQVGCTVVPVIRKPKILHLATGDELVPPDETPRPGFIRDTNSSLIAGLLAPFSPALESASIADNPTTMEKALDTGHDLFLLSGGASVGDHDHGADVLRERGFTIHFDKLNLRPGKPLTFATRGMQAAFVIPGNPVSHFVCFHVAIRLAIELMCGMKPAWDFLDLEINNPEAVKPNPRETFWPASVSIKNGALTSTPKHWSTSGDTFSLTGTNALIRVNADEPRRTLLLDLPHPSQ